MAPGFKPFRGKRSSQWLMPQIEHQDNKLAIGGPNRGGRPKFVPTDEQRADVELMACGNLSQERIAAIIRHPTTGKPIVKETLIKAFKDELENGKTRLQKKILAAFVKKLEAEEKWAIELGLKVFCGMGMDSPGMTVSIGANGMPNAEKTGIRLEFITPDPKRIADDPMPTEPYNPRPISRSEMYDAANTAFPHRIEGKKA